MKKTFSLVIALVLSLSVSACNGEIHSPSKNKMHRIGDVVRSDAMEVILTDIEHADTYTTTYSGKNDEVIPRDEEYQFIIVEFSVKNIGGTELRAFPSPPGEITNWITEMVTVDYNNGYTFYIDDVHATNHTIYSAPNFQSPRIHTSQLKVLGEAKTAEVAILVPDEVIENTKAPLRIKFSLPTSTGNVEEVFYTIR